MQLIALHAQIVEGRPIASGETFTATPALGDALIKAGAAKAAPAKATK
jgi:hypothetical protein